MKAHNRRTWAGILITIFSARLSCQLRAPAALPPGKNHRTHCIRGWVGRSAGLNALEKKNKYLACAEIQIPGPSIP